MRHALCLPTFCTFSCSTCSRQGNAQLMPSEMELLLYLPFCEFFDCFLLFLEFNLLAFVSVPHIVGIVMSNLFCHAVYTFLLFLTLCPPHCSLWCKLLVYSFNYLFLKWGFLWESWCSLGSWTRQRWPPQPWQLICCLEHSLHLASSPTPIFATRTQRDALTDIWKREKEGLVHTAGVIVRMRADFPRIWGSRNLS